MKSADNALWATENLLRTLQIDAKEEGTLLLHYRLCVFDFATPQYYAEVALDTERCAVCLGEERAVATRIYAQLLQGGVTPCTLRDVVRDLRACMEFF